MDNETTLLGRKFDDYKARWDQLPWDQLRRLAQAHAGLLGEFPRARSEFATPRRDDLIPKRALEQVARVLGHGAQKYGEENWREVPEAKRRYFAAAVRHIVAWWLGERCDPETGLHHLAHAACCVLFLLDTEVRYA